LIAKIEGLTAGGRIGVPTCWKYVGGGVNKHAVTNLRYKLLDRRM
jgi:hypothetical protein